ncbi:hypothetical protein [Lapillicoccus sp.]|uniref:hypothetical protein n=1 Tax=Lapillicoccus sp. TaxID=1909287 RepID=UPI0025DA31BE|nr:hypothetical protein [Lapillicoccus sp.]
MVELARPVAKRLQRPSWRDSRLIIGIVLVLLATTLGAKVIASADDDVPMYAAARALKPGDALSGDNLVRVDVRLGDRAGRYLTARAGVPADRFALRIVPEGELVPLTAIGGRSDVDVQSVTVKVDATSVASLAVGSVVDVWVSPRDPASTQARYLEAVRTIAAVSVAGVPQAGGAFGGSGGEAAVQLLVPKNQVATVISASDRLSRFTLVPVPGSKSAS